MKNFLYISFVFLFVLTSCASDDSGNSVIQDDFTGTYTLTSVTTSEPLDTNDDGTFDDSELIDNITCVSNVTLNSNNTFTWSVIQVTGDGQNGIICSLLDTVSGAFTRSGDSFTFNGANFTGTMVRNDNVLTYVPDASNQGFFNGANGQVNGGVTAMIYTK